MADPYHDSGSFDFTHVELAIRYHKAPSEDLLGKISESSAAIHLKRHSDRTGYYPADASPGDITENLLGKPQSPETLQAVGDLLSYAKRNVSKQKDCIATASSYLPDKGQPKNPLHVTWGYDIGVAMDDHASLNFTHPHFLGNHQEIWFYCIHEVHHSGVMQIHPMPRIADIDSVRELYDFARYATFLEGLAVYSAMDARRDAGALGSDIDYLVLVDKVKLDRILTTYENRLSYLLSEVGRPLLDEHWQVIEEMSSGERLWYVAGAAMAAIIEENSSRSDLLNLVVLGPAAFFDAYDRAIARTELVD
jgi:hypothetical protein